MNAADSISCLFNGCFKTKRTVDKLKVIVNCFRDSDYCTFQTTFFNFTGNIIRTALSSITSNYIQLIDVHTFNAVNNVNNAVSTTTACTKERTANLMNCINIVRIQRNSIKCIFIQKTFVTKAETCNSMNAITLVQTTYNCTNNIV